MPFDEFMKAVIAYGLKPHDLLPITRIISGRQSIVIQRNGVMRTYDGESDWARRAIADLHSGIWGPPP